LILPKPKALTFQEDHLILRLVVLVVLLDKQHLLDRQQKKALNLLQ